MDRGDLSDAQTRFLEGEKIASALSNSDPDNVERLRDLAVWQDRLGELSRKMKKVEEAFAYQEKAIAIRRKLVAAVPTNFIWQRDLGIALSERGNWYLEAGQFDRANELFTETLTIRRAVLAADPESSLKKRDLLDTLGRLGEVESEKHHPENALGRFEECLNIARQVTGADAKNVPLQNDLVLMLGRVGDTLLVLECEDEAISRYEERLQLCEVLAKNHPNEALKQREVAICHSLLAEGLMQAEKFEAAIEHLQLGIDALRSLVNADQAEQTYHDDIVELEARVRIVRKCQLAVGASEKIPSEEASELLEIRARYYSRRHDLEELVRIAEKLSSLTPVTVESTYNAACVFCLCAENSTKNKANPSVVDMSLQKRYVDIAFEHLNYAIALGFSDFEALRTHRQLTALRDLHEFEQLISRDR